ncbi:DUF2062 domain-containing protein [Lysinibacillus endophyticus]|uniref:DUF2062 domain-containing protein n=1 Tax=Ureibacillus endophyticus TaxID=1978490 RepID=A0A494Z8Z6_9BACL|nr:DUF2062 domain-containing protein [Lysinibacillus endophyticus]MCP1143453.1 DUF2062 domain-containing protein [Lysinibacillus endophyticus]RKQ19075.1 DUF2062 domain-containing protein [Lysinibacillus endophyticus]
MKIRRRIKYYLIRLFRLKSSPHQVALGLTMGFIPSWIPLFGFGPVLSIGLAKLTRSNPISAFVGGVIGTPIWPLLFILNYMIGGFLLDRKPKVDTLEEVEYSTAIQHTLSGFFKSHTSGVLFLTGAIINIVLSSILIYFMTFFLFKKYRVTILNKLR